VSILDGNTCLAPNRVFDGDVEVSTTAAILAEAACAELELDQTIAIPERQRLAATRYRPPLKRRDAALTGIRPSERRAPVILRHARRRLVNCMRRDSNSSLAARTVCGCNDRPAFVAPAVYLCKSKVVQNRLLHWSILSSNSLL